MNSFQHIKAEKAGQVFVVSFNSTRIMDPMIIDEIGRELQALFDEHPSSTFVLDLKNVEFLSSAVLNRLIVLDKSVKSDDGAMAFCGLTDAVSEVFAITKLDLLFNLYRDREAALDDLQN